MVGHIVLLGDSIFDNAAYVPAGQAVIDQLQQILPADWKATLLAIDGATMSSVRRQLQELPASATHLILSVGGNDLLGFADFIMSEPSDSYAAALAGIARIRDSFSKEYGLVLDDVRSVRLPISVCTIYDSIPGLGLPESAGLSIFNDAITKHVFSTGATLIDLRLICDEPTDYSPVSPIEPSASGGRKIAMAIHRALFGATNGCRVVAQAG